MKTNKLALTLVLTGALALPGLARAQASASIQLNLGLPVVMPQMVVVSPGIQVVPDVEEEVFYTRGYYWCRHDDGWYRTRDVHRGWYYMDSHRVPPGLSRMPPGKYRKWHPEHGYAHGPGRYGPGPGRYAPGPRHAGPSPVRYAPAPARYDRGGDRDHGPKQRQGNGHGKHGRD
jgi:hypothetical protein